MTSEDHLRHLFHLLSPQHTIDNLKAQADQLSGMEWETLVSTAERCGLLPLLHWRIQTLDQTCVVPDDLHKKLHRAFLINASRNTLFLHEAGNILASLKAASISAIGLKGLYLLENVFENVGMRFMSDLDILLHKEDIPSALSICQALGYQPTTYFDISQNNLDIKHVPPLEKENGPYLELHWTILEENEPFSIDAGGLWARANPVQIAGVNALALSPEDLVLHLCLHLGYQHNFKLGLRGLFDIAAVLHHFAGQVDWRKMIGIAQNWGAERVLRLTLGLVDEIFPTPLPPDAVSYLQQHPLEHWALEQATTQLLGSRRERLPMTPDLAEFAHEGGIFSRIRQIWRRVFLPKTTLARLYDVPPDSIRIYFCYFQRLFDLVHRYSRSVFRLLSHSADALAGVDQEQSLGRLRQWMIER